MSHPAPPAAPHDTDRPTTGTRPWARPAVAAAVAAALLAVSWALVEAPATGVPGWEADVFDAANGLPDPSRVVLWPIMQLGTLPVWVVGAAIAYAVTRRWRAALAAPVAVLLAWLIAPLVKDTVERGRPPELLDDVDLREHGVDGYGYASGHTTVAFAVATVLTAVLPGRWRWIPYPLAALVGLARMFFGVHFPLDVVGGAGLGTLCGLAALASLGVVGRTDRTDRGDRGDQPAASPGAG